MYVCWLCRRTGVIRSAGPKRHESTQGRHNPIKHKRKPPKGMHLDAKDLTDIISEGQCKAESMLKTLDSDVVSLKRQVDFCYELIIMVIFKCYFSGELIALSFKNIKKTSTLV